MLTSTLRRITTAFVFILLLSSGFAQKSQNPNDFPWKSPPKATNWVNDFEDIFTNAEERKLEKQILAFKAKTGMEIAIVTIDKRAMTAEEFDAFTLEIAKDWAFGSKEKNDGMLIAISKGLRRIYIHNGIGTAEIFSDAATAKIIDEVFIPAFKKGEYYQGTKEGLKSIIKKLKE
ncbi:MAG: TPM domain-containing protein [Flavobacteriales bacterium]|nr:TPM domain-containing protein [Flavobacteriales bacterium]NCA22493.1 TPM domain-containing protein [Crocinitomicaceae bacterium]